MVGADGCVLFPLRENEMAHPNEVGKRLVEFLGLPPGVVEFTLHGVAGEYPVITVKRYLIETNEVVTEEGRLCFEKNEPAS